MSEKKMVRDRSIAITLGIMCIVLVVVGSVGALIYVMPMINDKNNTISSLNAQISQYNTYNANLQVWLLGNITAYNNYVDDHNYTNEQYASEYELGYKAGVNSRGFKIVDPTYQQMLNFMATDTVHDNTYSSSYTCFNFASDFARSFQQGLSLRSCLHDLQ
jgi:hypothetical protein